MSLVEILQIERERMLRERVVLTTVYDRMKNKINNCVRIKQRECIYTIPEFIFGYPLINIDKTMNYLLSKLNREGFIALQLSAFDLYITWDPHKIKQLHSEIELPSSFSKLPEVDKSIQKKLSSKEFERANEDFINSLLISKKSKKF